MHNEKWVSPYNGGAELAGCGGGEGTFAKKPALEQSLLEVPLPDLNLSYACNMFKTFLEI